MATYKWDLFWPNIEFTASAPKQPDPASGASVRAGSSNPRRPPPLEFTLKGLGPALCLRQGRRFIHPVKVTIFTVFDTGEQ